MFYCALFNLKTFFRINAEDVLLSFNMSFELKRKQVCFWFPPVLGSLCKMSYAKVVLAKIFQRGDC
jgi:hypothetical protein